MSEQGQGEKPVTYSDVFPGVEAQSEGIAKEAVTMEDAALMQCAETLAFGNTQKGGAASAMQAAAQKNIDGGHLGKDAHSSVAESGVTVSELAIPGSVANVTFVGDQAVTAAAHATPTTPILAALDAVTIGEALESAAIGSGDRPITESDARAIMSAEARATGSPTPAKGGIGAAAQAAAAANAANPGGKLQTLSSILMDATIDLPMDKVVTHEDVIKVLQAEVRGLNDPAIEDAGIGAALAAAADVNEVQGFISPAAFGDVPEESEQKVEAQKEEEEPPKEVESELNLQKYVPLENEVHPNKKEEETTPLVSHGSAQQV